MRPPDKTRPEPAVRPAVQILVWVAGLICVVLLAVHYKWIRTSPRGEGAEAEVVRSTQSDSSQQTAVEKSDSQRQSGFANTTATGTQPRATEETFHVEPLSEFRQLVDSLVQTNLAGGELTAAAAAAWQAHFRQLVQQGDIAIPAIRDFLEKHTDVGFGPDTAKMLGYDSARMAMIDALLQIGSPTAATTLDETLKSTADPQEVGQLALDLEKLNPGTYQQDMLGAARQALVQCANGSMSGKDVAPLFQVLQQFGGADAVGDLEGNMGQWNHYASIALAQLPNGAGVPALVQVASSQDESSSSERTAALQALSGMTSQSADARAALVNLARQNSLSPSEWSALVPFLAGNQSVVQNSMFGNPLAGISPADLRATYVSSSQQSFWTAPLGAMTDAQIGQESAFLDQMLAVTGNPAAVQALQQAKALLDARRIQLASSSGN